MEAYSSRLSIPHKVFWDWDIHYSCNYRCSYCFLTDKWEKAAQANRYPGTAKWIEIWKRIYERYGSCHIHFSGGEPFEYPDFFTLITELSKSHTLEFSTNLSFDVAAFIRAVDCHKIRLSTSFHPEFSNYKIFLEKILLLKQNNFCVNVTHVAYPPLLEAIKKIKTECDTNSILFILQPFRGIFQGRIYPESYTQQEENMIRAYGTNFFVNEVLLNYHMLKKGKKENVLCRMGQMYAKIYASADVYRCEATESTKIGNLLDNEDFRLFDKAMPCNRFPCSCCEGWRAMIVGEEEKWVDKWR